MPCATVRGACVYVVLSSARCQSASISRHTADQATRKLNWLKFASNPWDSVLHWIMCIFRTLTTMTWLVLQSEDFISSCASHIRGTSSLIRFTKRKIHCTDLFLSRTHGNRCDEWILCLHRDFTSLYRDGSSHCFGTSERKTGRERPSQLDSKTHSTSYVHCLT